VFRRSAFGPRRFLRSGMPDRRLIRHHPSPNIRNDARGVAGIIRVVRKCETKQIFLIKHASNLDGHMHSQQHNRHW